MTLYMSMGAVLLGSFGFLGSFAGILAYYLVISDVFRNGLISIINSFHGPPARPIIIQQPPPPRATPLHRGPARAAAPLPASKKIIMPPPSIRRSPEHPPVTPPEVQEILPVRRRAVRRLADPDPEATVIRELEWSNQGSLRTGNTIPPDEEDNWVMWEPHDEKTVEFDDG